MATLNKRQQARNERTLQELIKSVPGNDRCADCGARNPGWASWSLGIFLCMRCAALHRKMGTHISKVKSLSMDAWASDQVDTMKRVGNTASNRLYNPRNAKPSIPVDVDEVDGAMERYIRQKYEFKLFSHDSQPGTRHNTGSTSTSSAEDRPPPLPPKPSKRFNFGLRSASSTFPLSKHHHSSSPPVSPVRNGSSRDSSPPGTTGQLRGLGGGDGGGNFQAQLAALRDMGFTDERKNLAVLRGLNGNVDRAVEMLIRMGGDSSKAPSRNHTPAPLKDGPVNGLSIDKTRQAQPPQPNNPFDMLPQQQQQQQQPPAQQPATAYAASYNQPTQQANPYNPFLQSSQPQQPSFEQSFQTLSIDTQQLPPPAQLFPHSTGGYATQSPQHNPFFQTFTPPPIPTMKPNSTYFDQQLSSQQQQQQQQQQPPVPFQQSQPTGGNPFLRSMPSRNFSPTNPFQSHPPPPIPEHEPQQAAWNGFQSTGQAAPQQQQSPFQQQQPVPQQQSFTPQQQTPFQAPPNASQQPQFAQQRPQDPTAFQSQPPQQPFQPQQQQQQQQQPFNPQPGRFDKSSILALYNYPQLAPPRPISTEPTHADPNANPDPRHQQQQPKRSVTMGVGTAAAAAAARFPELEDLAGSAVGANGMGAGGGGGTRHVSHDSVDFSNSLLSGRQSPDAFAGLSSRFVR